jgi:hypothetical protein
MTNVYGRPEKAERRSRLFQVGVQALQAQGWSVERIAGIGKSSVRRITKNGETRKVSIRTTQDTWIAFPRNNDDTQWVTLSEVDAVVAVSVDTADDPKFALVHMIEGDEMRDRFDRAYAARMRANYSIPLGRGVWVALYIPEANDPPTHVGAGAGIDNPPIARVPLEPDDTEADDASERGASPGDNEPLTIAEAKRRLAVSLGVDPSSIKITIEA